MIQAIIFDFDGTLTELTLDFKLLKEEILKIAEGFLDKDMLKQLEDLFIIEMIYEVERLAGVNGKLFSQKAFKRLEELEIEAASGKDLFPYTREVLRELKSRGIKLGIITRTCMNVLNKVFPDMSEYIHAISTREHARHVKPDPRHVEHVLQEVSTRPEEAMVVGDHPTDVIAGLNAGLLTVGVLSGRTERCAFENVGAHFIVNDIREILPIVDSLSK